MTSKTNASPSSLRSSGKTTPSRSPSSPTTSLAQCDDATLEARIEGLLGESRPADPATQALAELWDRYRGQLAQLEKLTSIADGYQSALRAENLSVTERYSRELRRLKKIVRISDRYQQMQQELNQALMIASTHDPLTELPNRRLMMDRLQSEAALSSRQGYTFTLALMDVDHFKRVNDEFGHAIGDATLVAVARTLRGGLRAYDVCARWGGEEFLVLMPGTLGTEALGAMNRMCGMVADLELTDIHIRLRLTVSVGVAEHRSGVELDETIRRADAALYRAKRTGRNRVVFED